MKKKVIKDYQTLPESIREAIREKYPYGYINHIITFFNSKKQLVSALPFETEEISYLIKMPSSMYLEVDEDDSDSGLEIIPEGESLEGLYEEKYLIQEEEEEESD